MALTALLDLQLDPERLDYGHQVLRETLVDTRAFPGCLGVEVLTDVHDPCHMMVVESWATAADDAAYRNWRAGAGASRLSTVLTGKPTLTRFAPEPGI
jgi:quinol monooxygenase YgiN